MKNCPYCHELIQDDAIKCRFCGEFLSKAEASNVPKLSQKPNQSDVATSMSSNVSNYIGRVTIFLLLGGIFAIVVLGFFYGNKPTFPYAAIAITIISAFICLVSIKNLPRNRNKYVSLLAFTIPFLIVGVLGYSTGYSRYKHNLRVEKEARATAIERQKQLEAEAAKKQLEIKYNQEHKEEHYQNALALLKENKYPEAMDLLLKVVSVDEKYKDAQARIYEINKNLTKVENERKSAQANQYLVDAEKFLNSHDCADINSAIRKSEAAISAIPTSTRAQSILLKAKLKKLSCYEGNGNIQMAIQIQEYKPLRLHVWIKNVSDVVRHANPNHFTLVTVDGRSYSVSSETYGLSSYFDAVDLQPGTETAGSIIFDTYAKPKKLVYSELLGSTVSRDFPFQ